jgi:hypothetical protein
MPNVNRTISPFIGSGNPDTYFEMNPYAPGIWALPTTTMTAPIRG